MIYPFRETQCTLVMTLFIDKVCGSCHRKCILYSMQKGGRSKSESVASCDLSAVEEGGSEGTSQI